MVPPTDADVLEETFCVQAHFSMYTMSENNPCAAILCPCPGLMFDQPDLGPKKTLKARTELDIIDFGRAVLFAGSHGDPEYRLCGRNRSRKKRISSKSEPWASCFGPKSS